LQQGVAEGEGHIDGNTRGEHGVLLEKEIQSRGFHWWSALPDEDGPAAVASTLNLYVVAGRGEFRAN
jgi:hypothetical protein